MNKFSNSQVKTLATLTSLLKSGPVDVTFGGIKGVSRSSLWSLESVSAITIERRTVAGRNYPDMFVTEIN